MATRRRKTAKKAAPKKRRVTRSKSTAKKTTRKKVTKKQTNKMLSWGKIKRALDEMQVPAAKFIKVYEGLERQRGMTEPEAYEIKAVAAFQKSGDLEALMKAIETDNANTASNTVRRVIQHQAARA